jgi:hypothetical protein
MGEGVHDALRVLVISKLRKVTRTRLSDYLFALF